MKSTLQTDLENLLSGETAILAPGDAPALARALVDQLPSEYEAVPEMLAALEAFEKDCDAVGDDYVDNDWPDLFATLEQARVVIAKVRAPK